MRAAKAESHCRAVVVLAGDFVQRGESAVLSRERRVRLALEGGASVVLAWPFAYVMQSAENYAYAPAALCARLRGGYYSFGSELALDACTQMAELFERSRSDGLAREYMRRGMSFPKAFAHLARDAGLDIEGCPNAALGAMYIRWLSALAPDVRVIAIKRDETYASAGSIRESIARGDEYESALAPGTACALKETTGADRQVLSALCLRALREGLCETELGRGALRKAREAGTYEEFLQRAKTRNITLARIKRAALRAAVGLDADALALINTRRPIFARLLGYRREDADIVKAMGSIGGADFFASGAAYRPGDEASEALWACECAAADMYSLLCGIPSGREYTQRVITL